MKDKSEEVIRPKQCHACKYFRNQMGWVHNGACCVEVKVVGRDRADIACRHGVRR